MGPHRRVTRKVPFNTINIEKDSIFWSKFARFSLSNEKRNHSSHLRSRTSYLEKFFQSYRTSFKRKRSTRVPDKSLLEALRYWVKYQSWLPCERCGLLHPQKLDPKSLRSKGCRSVKTNKCICTKGRYVIPSTDLIPPCLASLTNEDLSILRISLISM